MPTARTPENARWTRSAEKIEILYQLRALWLDLGLRHRAVEPVPQEWEHYFEDLRRNRLDIGPTLARFFDTIERRRMGIDGRRMGDQALVLLRQYHDLCFPSEPVQRPALVPNTYHVRGLAVRRRSGAA